MNKEKRSLLKNDGVQSFIASIICILLGLLLGYVVLLFINPAGAGEAITSLVKNFFNYPNTTIALKYFGSTLVKTAPLLMCALAILFAYKVGLFNIGAAGQYCAGVALSLYAALGLGWSWLPCMLLAICGGAILGGISGLLKSYCNVNEVISGIQTLKTPPAVGYLPQGSTNDFAASLEIPSDPVQAAEAIVRDQRRQLDIGRFGERIFVYVASFGAFTRTSYTASQDVKNALGHFGYLLESLRDLDTLRPYKVRITADGETLDGEYLFGAVANSTSIAGMMKLEREEVILDDGLFELLLVPHPQNASELQNLIWALLNQQYNSGGLIFRHVSALHVETDEDLPWSLDGEYEPSQPTVDITNCQRALTMLL